MVIKITEILKLRNIKYRMAKDQSSQKKRLPNFSNLEKIKLIELVEREKNILENKKTDNVSVKDKDTCWKNITKEFNSSSISGHRNVVCLKNCWDNLKKKTRKYYAEMRNEVFKTGILLCFFYLLNILL